MSRNRVLSMRNRVAVTILLTAVWLVAALGWLLFTWNQYTFFQHIAGLGIAILFWAASMGILWVADMGFNLAATVLTTFGGLSFLLYWLAFAWRQHNLLQNGAVLLLTPLAWVCVTALLWLAKPSEQWC